MIKSVLLFILQMVFASGMGLQANPVRSADGKKILGYQIVQIDKESKLAQAGVQKGDILKSFDQSPLQSKEAIFVLFKLLKTPGKHPMTIERDGATKTILVEGGQN